MHVYWPYSKKDYHVVVMDAGGRILDCTTYPKPFGILPSLCIPVWSDWPQPTGRGPKLWGLVGSVYEAVLIQSKLNDFHRKMTGEGIHISPSPRTNNA